MMVCKALIWAEAYHTNESRPHWSRESFSTTPLPLNFAHQQDRPKRTIKKAYGSDFDYNLDFGGTQSQGPLDSEAQVIIVHSDKKITRQAILQDLCGDRRGALLDLALHLHSCHTLECRFWDIAFSQGPTKSHLLHNTKRLCLTGPPR